MGPWTHYQLWVLTFGEIQVKLGHYRRGDTNN